MPSPYEVELTATAEATFSKLYLDAQECIESGDETNFKVKLYRMVEELLTKIIPQDPFSPSRALSGSLSNFFRVKKGRIRVCYVGSSKKKKIYVLYISETLRKDGDKNDPYAIFTRLARSGKFDDAIAKLGLKSPGR
jgi:mRNA-degrading endonuclease RelE of RelBE toxin-antitoxin system